MCSAKITKSIELEKAKLLNVIEQIFDYYWRYILLQATAELNEAFKRPEAISALCEIVVSSKEPQHRQYSAVLLSKRLGKLRNWQLVPVEQQALYVKYLI